MAYTVVNYWVTGYAVGDNLFDLQKTLQGVENKTIVELFDFELNAVQHGETTTYRFTNTKNELGNNIVWQENTYTAIPMETSGYEATGQGTLPRPNISVANLLGTFTAILSLLPDGLEGCKVTRTRTLAKYLDAVNFSSVGTYVDSDYWAKENETDGKPYTYSTDNDPDPTSYFRPRDIYFIDRKSMENRDVISYEMCSAFDLAGVRLPKRQILPDDFPGVGTFSY
jgi:phage-related protein